MRELAELCCVNPDCHDCGLRGKGNLKVRKVYGKDGIRFLRCTTCGEEFSERRGTAMFNMKLPHEKAVAVLEHVQEGVGVRATGRLTRVDKDTVCRLIARAGRHAKKFHDQSVAFSP